MYLLLTCRHATLYLRSVVAFRKQLSYELMSLTGLLFFKTCTWSVQYRGCLFCCPLHLPTTFCNYFRTVAVMDSLFIHLSFTLSFIFCLFLIDRTR